MLAAGSLLLGLLLRVRDSKGSRAGLCPSFRLHRSTWHAWMRAADSFIVDFPDAPLERVRSGSPNISIRLPRAPPVIALTFEAKAGLGVYIIKHDNCVVTGNAPFSFDWSRR